MPARPFGWILAVTLSVLGTPSIRPAMKSGAALPIGTAWGDEVTCQPGGLSGTACYTLTIHCPAEGIAPITASLKVIAPTGSPLGTVTFEAGGGGTAFYDVNFIYGSTAVEDVVNAGYTAVEMAFTHASSGWLTGPGGPLNLACRYATANEWVYTHLHQGGGGAPFCATGNSGGAGAIGYALAQYGMGSVFAMVEVTSGPVFSRVDYGCVCNQPDQLAPCGQGLLKWCYGTGDAEEFIDPAYGNTWCSTDIVTGGSEHDLRFHDDSIDSPTASYAYPATDVHVVFGGLDTSCAVPQGSDWVDRLTTRKSTDCVPDAGHALPGTLDGAQKVADDLINYCKLQ